jgi:hypothetical protein
MPDDTLPEEWAVLRGWLPADLEQSAAACKFTRRTTGRVTAETWLRLILMHVTGGLSLEQTMLRAAELGWCELSAVALFKRLRVAQHWLIELCSHLLLQQGRLLGESNPWPEGLAMRLIDATDVQEPGSTGTAWRIHYALRMPQMVCDHYELTDAKGGEKFGRFTFAKGELVIADRGYSHRAGVAHIIDSGGEVLVRWNPASLPMETSAGRPTNLLRWLRRLPAHGSREKKVWIRHDGRRYALRLCAIRKSRLAAEAARKKATAEARKDGRRIRNETLLYADYVMVLCSMRRSKLHRDAALIFYRGRWQIELAFKRLKSLLGAGHVPKESDASARSWIQAKILSSLLIERTLWEGEFLSPWGYGAGPGGTPESLEHIHRGARLLAGHSRAAANAGAPVGTRPENRQAGEDKASE